MSGIPAYEGLIVSVDEGVGRITLNRPEAMNAVTIAMSAALSDAVQAMETDPAVRCVLIAGQGPAFCAGGDVKGFHNELTADQAGHAASMEANVVRGHLAFHRLRRMNKPVIVAVHGQTVGMGISLLCCADIAIAARSTSFMLAYRHVGLSLDGGVSYFLPRIVGERRALDIALFGETFGTEEAEKWGLVTRIVNDADLLPCAIALAQRLAMGPTLALGSIKRLIRNALEAGWDEQSALEAREIAMTIGTADHLEGVTAFVEKRNPQFRGR